MKLRLFFSLFVVATAAAISGCGATGGYNLPPASRLMEPGPGVGGPGPGVLAMPTPGVANAAYGSQAMPNPGLAQAAYVAHGSYGPQAGCQTPVVGGGVVMPATDVQVLFARPEAMQVSFGTGGGAYASAPMITPARQNFTQGGVYRLKVTGIPGREGTELYPTLEVGPPTRQTLAYLAHNAIPVQFTEEDFDQVLSGNFVSKVIYLPDPDFQELALAGVETLVSTRLDPGLDPIIEADRRGSILAVIRIGNKDLEVPGGMGVSPITEAPSAAGVVPASHASAIGAGVAQFPTATGGVVQAGCLDGSCGAGGCNSCGGGSCNSCGGGGCLGGCLGGGRGTAADFYGPNSTPRGGFGPGGLPPGLAGGGQYGMPQTGTPIGLPGPPHVPLGVPAGLQKHVMHNWTSRHIPDPVSKLKINVKQRPGLSYPQPPNRAWVVEDTIHSAPHYSNHHFGIPPAAGGVAPGGSIQSLGAADCPDGSCAPTGHSGGLLGSMKNILRR